MKIEVRPIEKKSWHGKKGKESFTRPKKIQALADADTMQYAVELTEEEEAEYSKKLKKDLSRQFDPENTHEFWDSALATIKLENATMILDTKKAIDFIHWKIMRASKYVANSMKEYEEGMKSETHDAWSSNEMISYEKAIEQGFFAICSRHVQFITGRPAITLQQVIENNRQMLV
jgi:tRNA uridine 5-carbamoylmethylation protein Kti12